MSYLFILGREPGISLAEILAILSKKNPHLTIITATAEFLLIDKIEIEVAGLMKELGGTIKIGQVFDQIPCSFIDNAGEEKITASVVNFIKNDCDIAKKIFFGLSVYNLPVSQKRQQDLGFKIKKQLTVEEISCRMVVSRERNLSAVTIKLNKLLSARGAEILLAGTEKGIILAKTVAIQPFEEFGKRDFGRPGRDALSGMLPPKLALMMINLAGLEKNKVILDPFCGSGTIITEALLAGYMEILGSDNSPKAVEDTEKNIKWITDIFGQKNFPIAIKKCFAADLSKCYKLNSIDAIITEPYLGPPLKGRETEAQIENTIQELAKLYLEALQEMHKITKKDGVVIMIWPIFENKQMPLIKKLAEVGWQLEPFLPTGYEKYLSDRKTLVYARPDQKVKREIVKLKKIPN